MLSLAFASGIAPLDVAAPYQFIAWRQTPGPESADSAESISESFDTFGQ
jgi:hypothetical protein